MRAGIDGSTYQGEEAGRGRQYIDDAGLCVSQSLLISVAAKEPLKQDDIQYKQKERANFFKFYTLYFPFQGNLGRLTSVRLQQPQEQRYPVLQVHAGAFCVSGIHLTLDMDYRIFKMRM